MPAEAASDGMARGRLPSDVQDRREAAEDHALAIEGHGLAHGLHPGVGHDPLVRGVSDFLRGIFDPAEDDDLILLRLHGTAEVSELALRHVIAPALDHAVSAELL